MKKEGQVTIKYGLAPEHNRFARVSNGTTEIQMKVHTFPDLG
jgi:hypothetical protein